LTIVSWNVQALFDAIPDGWEYDEYSPDSGWTDDAYAARLMGIGTAILATTEGGPDIAVLIEVEGGSVTRDLVEGPLAKGGYRWYASYLPPGCPLAPAVISRFPILDARTHSVAEEGSSFSRPILEVRVDVDGQPLVILACHWKSKLGGADSTESDRIAAAAAVGRRIVSLAELDAELPVIVAGDLNESVDEFARRGRGMRTAILPEDADGALSLDSESTRRVEPSLVARSSLPPWDSSAEGVLALYSPWWRSPWRGSYYYDGWETIDHFLLSDTLFDGGGWDYDSFRVVDDPEFVNQMGRPLRYNPRTGLGLSDHLPILIALRRASR